MLRCLLIVPCLLLASGCSKAVSPVSMPLPPANLSSPCRMLPTVPEPLLDPDRLQWEVDVLAAYEDCAVKHRLTVDAWREAVKAGEK